MVRVSFAALAIMALLFSVIPDPGCLVTAANAGRLKAGMAHEQMFEIVGAPAPPAFQGGGSRRVLRDRYFVAASRIAGADRPL